MIKLRIAEFCMKGHAIKEEKCSLEGEAVWKVFLSPACPKEWDSSPSFPFPPSVLECHNGSRPGLDGGEMGAIKSDPQGAVRGCHMYGIAVSLWNSKSLCCRRRLLHWRNAAGDTYNYMTSRTLTAWHPQIVAMFVCVRALGCTWVHTCAREWDSKRKTKNIKWKENIPLLKQAEKDWG